VPENRILRNQITGRVRLRDGEHKTLAEIGKKLSKQALAEVASIATPDIILAWHRKLVAQKFDGWCSECGDTLFPMANKPLFLKQ
jgi:putative transposase